MKITDIISESAIGTSPKREKRQGSRPERGHEPQQRYSTPDYETRRKGKSPGDLGGADAWYHRGAIPNYYGFEKGTPEYAEYMKSYNDWDEGPTGGKQWDEEYVAEKASRQLCKSSTPDEDLGASNLASCKSQGLRARDGEKSHLIGHGNSAVRIKVGGKRIKGKKYGGPLPDYGTRKGQ